MQFQREAVKKVEPSVAYLSQNLDKPLEVCALAAIAGVSVSSFFRLFKRATGCSPILFFTHLRMRRACELLEGTILNVKEIARLLGYKDNLYFSRVFKLAVGVSPSAYRTMAAEGNPPTAWIRRITQRNLTFCGANQSRTPAEAREATIHTAGEKFTVPKLLFTNSMDRADLFDQTAKTVSANQSQTLKPREE